MVGRNNMKKLNRIISGSIAFAFSLGLIANVAKTDFQKHLEKTIKISVKPDNVGAICIETCVPKK
jgi:hypothetical protein